MSDLDQKVAAAKSGIASAQQSKARAEHAYGVAVAQAESAAGDLKAEFGVKSAAEARNLIAQLEQELETECSRVTEALSRARTGTGDAG